MAHTSTVLEADCEFGEDGEPIRPNKVLSIWKGLIDLNHVEVLGRPSIEDIARKVCARRNTGMKDVRQDCRLAGIVRVRDEICYRAAFEGYSDYMIGIYLDRSPSTVASSVKRHIERGGGVPLKRASVIDETGRSAVRRVPLDTPNYSMDLKAGHGKPTTHVARKLAELATENSRHHKVCVAPPRPDRLKKVSHGGN